MMALSQTIQIARKFYKCDACRAFLQSGYGAADLSPDDNLIVDGVEAGRWKICPGDTYIKITYVDCGDFSVYRGRVDIDALCRRHDLFEDA